MRRGFGFVVPVIEGRRIIAGSFSSLKFAGRAPDGCVLMRVFIGGALQKEMMALSDDEMVAAAARAEIGALLGVSAAPLLTRVRALGQFDAAVYAVGHLALVAEMRARQKLAQAFIWPAPRIMESAFPTACTTASRRPKRPGLIWQRPRARAA